MPCSNNTSDLSEAVRRDDQKAHAGPAAIAIREEFGWRRYSASTCVVWFKGWVDQMDYRSLSDWLADVCEVGGRSDWRRRLRRWMGISRSSRQAQDGRWQRSIGFAAFPLAVAEIDGAWTIDDQADRLRRRAGLSGEDINLDVAREIAMAGYGIDNRSLYNGLHVLGPGELMWFEENKEPRRTRYYTYRTVEDGRTRRPAHRERSRRLHPRSDPAVVAVTGWKAARRSAERGCDSV